MRSAEERTAALREAAKEPLYRLAPTLSLSGQVRLTADAVAPDKSHDESAQLTLTWNIYDAGVRYADRRVRVAQADSQALDERQLRRSRTVVLPGAPSSAWTDRPLRGLTVLASQRPSLAWPDRPRVLTTVFFRRGPSFPGADRPPRRRTVFSSQRPSFNLLT